jgi:hypothetical protein
VRELIDILFVPVVADRIGPLVGHGIPDALGHCMPLLDELLLGGCDFREQAAQLIALGTIAAASWRSSVIASATELIWSTTADSRLSSRWTSSKASRYASISDAIFASLPVRRGMLATQS